METIEKQLPTNRFFGSSRFGVTMAILGGYCLFYAMRADMSVAILCMVNHTALSETSSNNSQEVSTENGPFVWNGVVQNQILGAFFYGYLILQIPGGCLADALGGRWVMFSSIFGLSLFSILLPLVATSSLIVALLRALQGLASGAVIPAVSAIESQWAPPLERSSISAIAGSGLQLGNVLAFPISGLLCRYFNWQSVFIFWGILGFIWLIGWFFYGFNSPKEHPRISEDEKSYIATSLGLENGTGNKKRNFRTIPWLEFLKSPPFWACLGAQFGSDWGVYTFLSQTPRYMKTVHHFDIASNSAMSALPYLAHFFVSLSSGPLADMLMSRKFMSVLATRRLFTSAGFVLPITLLTILGYLPYEYWYVALATLIFIIATSGLQYVGWPITVLDISGPYAGIIFGILNTISCLSGVLTNSLAGLILSANPTLAEWRLLFFITAAVMAGGCLVYCIFASAETQPWAKNDSRREKVTSKSDEVLPLQAITEK